MSGRFERSDKHTLGSKPSDDADSGVARVRRIELITGTGRRRQWSSDDKARIVVESSKPGASVSDVARRHGLSPQQLFSWRRQARDAVGSAPAGRGSLEASRCAPATSGRVNLRGLPGPDPAFAPVVLAPATSASTPAAPLSPTIDTAMRGLIEIGIGDLTVRVRGQIETGLLITVLRAVRRAS